MPVGVGVEEGLGVGLCVTVEVGLGGVMLKVGEGLGGGVCAPAAAVDARTSSSEIAERLTVRRARARTS